MFEAQLQLEYFAERRIQLHSLCTVARASSEVEPCAV